MMTQNDVVMVTINDRLADYDQGLKVCQIATAHYNNARLHTALPVLRV